MPLAVAPAIVPDGGDVEDPEGDTDVYTAESDEEGGSDREFVLFKPVRSLASARLGQRHSGRLQAARQHLHVDMAVHKLQSTLCANQKKIQTHGFLFFSRSSLVPVRSNVSSCFLSTLGGAGRSSIRRCLGEGVTHLVRVSIP